MQEITNIAALTEALEQAHPAPHPFIGAEYLTKKELARSLRKSVRCIDNWIKSGHISYIKVGRRSVLFRWEDVQADLNRFRVNAR